eukprot:scaffold15018_cov202-Isochrysis_galbana.AAC.2
MFGVELCAIFSRPDAARASPVPRARKSRFRQCVRGASPTAAAFGSLIGQSVSLAGLQIRADGLRRGLASASASGITALGYASRCCGRCSARSRAVRPL